MTESENGRDRELELPPAKQSLPRCPYCNARPFRPTHGDIALPMPPGQVAPIVKAIWCADCEAIVSMFMVGAVAPQIVGATKQPPSRIIM